MRQFDIVENLNARTRGRYPLAVVLQHNTISGLPTMVVAPLTLASSVTALDHLHPTALIEGQTYRLVMEELAAIHRSLLGRTVGSAETQRDDIIRALDLLFTGI